MNWKLCAVQYQEVAGLNKLVSRRNNARSKLCMHEYLSRFAPPEPAVWEFQRIKPQFGRF
jgi:hypothetical protein